MSDDDAKLRELGDFLRTRRARQTPADVGLPEAGPRRVEGLRREEVADLAFISTDYYRRLERGQAAASPEVLDALAQALDLDDDERSYLARLAGRDADATRGDHDAVRPPLRCILDQLTQSPALVLGRCLDVLAWNPLAAALIVDFSTVAVDDRNYVRLLFTDPRVRSAVADWPREARTAVAFLRMHTEPDDPRLAALVTDLSDRSPDFRRWWDAHHVFSGAAGTKTYRHAVVGDVTVHWEILTSAADQHQQLIVMTADDASPSHDALLRLRTASAAHGCPAPR